MASYYWDPAYVEQSKPSSVKRIAAVVIILMLILGSGMIIIFDLFPGIPTGMSGNGVRVAVIDSARSSNGGSNYCIDALSPF